MTANSKQPDDRSSFLYAFDGQYIEDRFSFASAHYGDVSRSLITGKGYIEGTRHDDTIRGSDEHDAISGKGGNDTINGKGGDDNIGGGDGNDTIRGGDGINYLLGYGGQDTIIMEKNSQNDVVGGGSVDRFEMWGGVNEITDFDPLHEHIYNRSGTQLNLAAHYDHEGPYGSVFKFGNAEVQLDGLHNFGDKENPDYFWNGKDVDAHYLM